MINVTSKPTINIPPINMPPKNSPERMSPPGTFVSFSRSVINRTAEIIPNNILRLRSFIICLVLILVDSFLRFPQRDKMAVFYVLILIVHFCFTGSSGLHSSSGEILVNRNKPVRRSIYTLQNGCHAGQPFLYIYF